ncbi:shikimate kinase [Flavobacterium sp. GT3R68]|uniref:shikimate kinase n=1 Tax=Flavobacterium sp. GT3R68 TaxID=2594437 RepID=UPI000F88E33E|nr:shikimate kinase [Flavobacterium sp. GT3R68]RTY86773.1 shikimate kinase [Flavobacterium sp. GSN2]TRW89392.1 shikimate kinase [Flavobacterium sp. GT3R68]
MKKIILLGYMGCGKSTIAKLLSEKTGIPYLDLDEIIEEKTQMSIPDLFNERGEIYFRKLEHQIFQDLMTNSQSMVLSLGGGTPCYSNNHELLKGTGICSVYLAASIPTLYNRLIHNKTGRPLLANKNEDELKEFIAKHLFDRSFFYHQAQFKVNVDDKNPENIVSEIEGKLA